MSNGIAQVPADGDMGLAEAAVLAGRLVGNRTAGMGWCRGPGLLMSLAQCPCTCSCYHRCPSCVVTVLPLWARGTDGLRGKQPRLLACA